MTNGEIYYGSFMVTDYEKSDIPVTMLGFPTISNGNYKYPNQLVPDPVANSSPTIMVDPEYRLFYGVCGTHDYLKNVHLDPSMDLQWDVSGNPTVYSGRPYNQQQAQRILANDAQRLRGFQYPTRVHLDLENCDSAPSITPVAPDAPVIYISSQTGTGAGPYTVTIAWLHGFDGGSPITHYYVYKN
jgi:hypothetical protein